MAYDRLGAIGYDYKRYAITLINQPPEMNMSLNAETWIGGYDSTCCFHIVKLGYFFSISRHSSLPPRIHPSRKPPETNKMST